jgi:hypothetical protein
MRDPDAVLVFPKQSASTQNRNSFIPVLVVAISLGTGYGASRVWPLPMTADWAAPDPAKLPGATPEANDKPSPLPSAAAGIPRAPSPRELTTIQGQSDAGKIEARSTAPPASQLEGASVEQSAVAQEPPSQANSRTIHEPSVRVGRNIRSAVARARHARRAPLAEPAIQFASNPRPNQASRDFMGSRSRD